MRAKRTIVAVVTLAAVLAVPREAAANGGAYIELDREHYFPGSSGTAETYVTVPERREDIFDRGPFYLYLLPEGTSLEEGSPIPASAVRIGTFEAEEERKQWELKASFVVPEVEGDFYSLALCDDPCTVSGFRETLSAQISVVATRREMELLKENGRVWSKVYRWRHDAQQAHRRLNRVEEDLAYEVANGGAVREDLQGQVEALEADLAAAERNARELESRVPLDPWMAAAIVLLGLAAAWLVFRRRRLVAATAVGRVP
jgi:hypothetical protein